MLNLELGAGECGWPNSLFPPPDGVIFESLGGELRQLSASPDWLGSLETLSASAVSITDQLPFLESFLPEATQFWDEGRDGQLVSDFWTQTDASGVEIHLLAYALALKGQRLLLIRLAEALYREHERTQQHAHESVNKMKLAELRQRALDGMTASLRAESSGPETKDALTGIHNRRHFDERFELEVRDANEQNEPLSVLYLDIDHFQLFNDQNGRTAGDVYLRSVGQLIQGVLNKPRDVAARVGGEEFATLLPGTDGPQAVRLAHTLSRMIRELRVPNPISRGLLSATVSIGVFTRPLKSEETAVHMLRAVEHALAEAKRNGGNRVVLGDDHQT